MTVWIRWVSVFGLLAVGASASAQFATEDVAWWVNDGIIVVAGDNNTINGGTHAAGQITNNGPTGNFVFFNGATGNSFSSAVEYFGDYVSAPGNVFQINPVQAASRPFPFTVDLADYSPGGSQATAAGSAFVDLTPTCQTVPAAFGRYYRIAQLTLTGGSSAPGVYFADCQLEVTITGTMDVTFASPFLITLDVAPGAELSPFSGDFLVVSEYGPAPSDPNDRTRRAGASVVGSGGELNGIVVSPYVSVDGSGHTFYGGLFGYSASSPARLSVNGSSNVFNPLGATTPPPTPPVANADSASGNEDTLISIDVLANDDLNGSGADITDVTVTTPPGSGTVAANVSANTLEYTPNADYNGTDSFEYEVGGSAPALVSITIAPVNDAPVASNLTASGTIGETITIPIIASDPDGDPLTYQVIYQPPNSTITVSGDTFIVDTQVGVPSPLLFTYFAFDGQLMSSPEAVVTIDPLDPPAPPTPPVANGDTASVDEDASVVIDVLANDVPNGATLTIANVVVVTPPTSGTVIPSPGGEDTLLYTPDPDFNGSDAFVYRIDYEGVSSGPATVSIAVAPINDPPVASDLTASGVAGDTITVPIIASDPDGDTLTYAVLTQPAQGTATIAGENIVVDTVVGSPSPLQFTYSAADGGLVLDTGTVTITLDAPNEAPTISSTPAYVVPEQQTYSYAVQATDPNNDTLAYALGRAPAGASIDSATGVITWPATSADVNAVPDFNWLCREDDDLPLEDIVPQIKWEWLGSPSYPGVTGIKGPPVVGQLTDDNGDGLINEDDTPDVVFGANDRDAPSVGVMFALSGDTGAEIWAFDAISVAANGSLALGDIDGDGFVEIVAQDFARTQLFVLNHDGSLLWAVPTGPQHASQFGSKDGISLADLDGDGSPEIIHGRSVFNADGTLRWQGTGGHGGIIGYGAVSIVADVDLDGTPEVIAGNTIYDSVGNIKAQLPSGTDGYNAVGNFDADDEAEIVLVHSGLVALHNHDGSIIWNNRAIPGGGIGGPPTVADMDGDGEPEIGVAGRREYAVFETDGSLKWKFRVQDESSNRTGSSVFDFDNDGRAETLYIDEVDFFIFDSATGKLRYRDRNWSGTTLEYPSVVDVDGDGAADILVPSSQISPTAPGGGLRVLESALDPWPGTREIWNQHAYSIDNVNDDGTIPPSMAASWLSHNTFRLNTFIDESPLDQADLIVSELRLDAETGDLIVTVHNRGRRGSASTVTVGLFTAPNGGGTNLGYVDVGPLEAGLSASYSFSGINLSSVGDTIFAVVDAASVQLECFEQNNQAQSAFFEVTVDDGNGATDTQQFSVYVTDVNEAPQIVSDPVLSLEVGSPFADQVIAEDPDIGDAVAFSLTTFPNGLKINEKSGRITYDQFVLQAGLHPVTVLATDLRGLTATLSYDLNVTVNPDPNSDPEITSEPEALGEIGQDYLYTVIATDADFDALDYTLRIAPPGMTINNITGIISWQPTNAGQFPVVVVVDDGFGGEATQSYAVRIESGPANAAPVITSTPTSVVALGANYQYSVIATDADGDPLTYSLDVAPAGMGIDASGNISWLADRTGTMPVAVTVSDGVNEAVQNWLLTVPVAAGDLSATLTATPTVIELGQTVAFAAVANNASGTPTLALDVDGTAISLDAGGNGSFTPTATGAFTAVLTVTDGADTTSAVAVFQVIAEQQPNQPPVITSAPPQSVNNTTAYSYTVTATDPEGDTLSFSLPDAPTGMSIDSQTGLVSWLPDTEGNYTVAVRATDTSGNSATQSYTLSVVALGRTNVPPAFVSTPQLVTNLGQSYGYTAVATDADGDAVAYGLSVSPPGMSIDPLTGVVSWTPSQAEQVAVIIEAYDGLGGVATQAFSINVVAPANEAPAFTTVAPTTAVTGSTYLYGAAAADPDGDTINYSLLDAPAGMTVAADGTVIWLPVTSGNYNVTLQASDGIAAVTQSWMIVVADAAPLSAQVLVTPAVAEIGQSVTLSTVVTGNVGALSQQLLVDGQTLTLDAGGQAVFNPSTVGNYDVVFTVIDQVGNASDETSFLVVDSASPSAPPQVTLVTPTEGAEVTAPIDVVATIADDNLLDWRLGLRDRNAPISEFDVIAQGATTETNTVIGQVDPTLLLNGQYALILEATDQSGNVVTDSRTLRVTGDMKIGNFSVTFEDLRIDLAGIPVTVQRTYDSRRRSESLDFGYGWTVDYQNVRVHESRDIGFAWNLIEEKQGFFSDFCVKPAGDPTVTVRLPDGDIETFVARAAPECTQFGATLDVNIVFEPIDDTDSTLEVTDIGIVRLVNGNIVDIESPADPVDPDRYRLTTPEGMVYELDQNFGIRQIRDTHGHTVDYSDSGVNHSQGFAIDFTRDAEGRIIGVTAPDGTSMAYAYDAAGDLVSFTDQVGDETTFGYLLNQPHYLEDIFDPRGIRVARNEYDADGRLTAHIDADGNRIEYTHNIAGNTEIVKDRRGNSTTYVYDDEGNVLVETNALGETITRTYDDERNVLSETDPLGNTTYWTYNDRGDVLSEMDPLGNTTTFTYDDRSYLLTQTDPLGNVVMTNTYEQFNSNLLTTTDAIGAVTTFEWDSRIGTCSTGASRGYTDAEGNTFELQPWCVGPKRGLPKWEIDANGVQTDFTYDDMLRKIAEKRVRTDENGVLVEMTTSYEYDDKGRLTKVIAPDGGETTTTYNGIGKEATVTDALGRTTTYTYDARGNLIETQYPDLTTELMGYDEEGNVVSQTDRGGRTTTMVYDAANRLIETIYPDDTPGDLTDNPRASTEYDAAGRVVASIDERGNRTDYEYDAAGRRTRVIDALLNATEFEYDERGLRTAMIDARNNRTEYVYDSVGRMVQTIFPDLESSFTAYDLLGRKVSETDRAGEVTQFEYDGLGRLTAVVDALSQRTEYEYDEQGNKLIQRDALLRETSWTYDDLGRVTGRTLPMGQSESMTYDLVGNMLTRTDFNLALSTFTYDVMNRQSTASYADTTSVTSTYTPTGLMSTVTNENGLTTYLYDVRDRLIRVDYPDGGYIDYAYDPAGNRVALDTAHQSITYGFDSLNRLASVTDAQGVTAYSYDAVGNRARIDYANGTYTTYVYDSLNRLTTLTQLAPGDVQIAQHNYTLGLSGNRTALSETLTQPGGGTLSRTTSYTYDALYRLTDEVVTDATNGNRNTTWAYDSVGNRLSQDIDGVVTNYSYDANDRLIDEQSPTGLTQYSYDANGNTLLRTTPFGATDYAWDSRDRMISVDGGATTHTYDSHGVRQSTASNGVITRYLVDPNRDYEQVLEDRDDTGALLVSYTYGDDLISQHRVTGALPSDRERRVLHADGLGSTRLLTDGLAGVTDSFFYTAFGEDDVVAGVTDTSYRFAGEQFDQSIGFYYLRARYYDPSVGRLLSMDTYLGRVHEPQTLHKYLYVHANPIMNVDPSGNMTIGEITAGLNSAANLTTSAIRIGKTVNQIQNLVDFVVTAKELTQLDFGGVLRDSMKQSAANLGRVDVDRAIGSLLKMTPTVSSLATGSWFSYIMPRAAQLDRIVIYLPQAPVVAELPLTKKKNIDIVLRVDPIGKDRVTGVGIAFGKKTKVHQIWRMDSHSLHDGRNPTKDAHFLVDGDFHYHVRKPPRR